MISSPSNTREIGRETISVDPGEKPASRRPLFAGALLFLAVLAALVAGGWGVLVSVSSQAPPARIGDTVEVSGGFLRVDGVTPENMAPMQSGKFGASGMSMSSSGMDMAPEGSRRFTVDVSLAASENGSLGYSAEDFKITGSGMKETGPIRHQLEAGTLPPGSATSGVLIFQAPEKARNLTLTFDDGRQPVALDLPAGGHPHGDESQPKDDGHSHGAKHD